MRPGTRSRLLLAAVLLFMGSLHFLMPEPFVDIVPAWVGHGRFWVYASGVCELVSGALLLRPATVRAGGWMAAATLVGVWPANIQMASDAGLPGTLWEVALWLRVPLQVPLVLWALRHARA